MKECGICQEDKTEEEFPATGFYKGKVYRKTVCKLCYNKSVREKNLKSGKVSYNKDKPKQDLVGQRFGKLVVKDWKQVPKGPLNYLETLWLCACDCGKEKYIRQADILSGKVKSCRCGLKKSGNPSWQGVGNLGKRYHTTLYHGAIKRNLDFTITLEEMWEKYQEQGGRCALTGWEIGFDNPQDASLDRIDSSKGYTPDNIQWVHKDINLFKWNHTEERLLEMCRAYIKKHDGG